MNRPLARIKALLLPRRKWGIFAFTLLCTLTPFLPALAQDGAGPAWYHTLFFGIAYLFVVIAQAIGQFLIVLLDVVIQVMQYNGFTTSPVVSAGWTVVRDFVNMFFVVILIIVAMGTIFGVAKFKWHQQVIRLGIFAIVINFSKLIVGLVIDASQVVMLTFANALKDIAGGNFIQLFGLGDILNFSPKANKFTEALEGGGQGLNSFDFLASGFLALFMMLIVLMTTIALAAILVWRIVMLWVLIVLSPLAFFLYGASGVIGDQGFGQWKNKFKCAVIIGPLLAFFLWLTLAVAGAGNIAASEGFTSGLADPSRNNSDLIGRIFEMDRIISFIIGIGMIFAGFEAATSVCSGGFVGKALGGARAATRGAIVGAGALAGAAGVATARFGGRKTAEGLERGTRGARIALARTSAGLAERAGAGTTSPRVAAAAARLKTAGEAKATELERRGARGIETAPPEVRSAQLDSLARRKAQGGKLTSSEERMMKFGLAKDLSDPKRREDLEKKGLLEHAITGAGGLEALKNSVKGDEKMTQSVKDFEKSRPDLAARGADGTIDKEKLRGQIGDMDAVRALGADALRIPEMKEVLAGISSGTVDKDGNEVMADTFVEKGRLGNEKRQAFQGGMAQKLETAGDEYVRNTGEERILQMLEQSDPAKAQQALEKNQALSVKVLASNNPQVQLSMSPQAGDSSRLRYESALKGLGVNKDAGTVDAERFGKALGKDPRALGGIRLETFNDPKLKKQLVSATAGNLGDRELKTAVNAVKKDPIGNERLMENLDYVMQETGNAAEYGADFSQTFAEPRAYVASELKNVRPQAQARELTPMQRELPQLRGRVPVTDSVSGRRAAQVGAQNRMREADAIVKSAQAEIARVQDERAKLGVVGEQQAATMEETVAYQTALAEQAQESVAALREQITELSEQVAADEREAAVEEAKFFEKGT